MGFFLNEYSFIKIIVYSKVFKICNCFSKMPNARQYNFVRC